MTTKTGKKSAWKKDDLLTAYLVLLPSFLLLVTFVIAPLVISVVNSFYDSSAYMDAMWKGMGNYTKVLTDEKFWKSIGVGLKFILSIVPIQLILAFFIAHLVIQLPKHLSSFVKVTVYMPCLLSGIIVGAIFSYIYASDAGGFLNNLLSKFGGCPHRLDGRTPLGAVLRRRGGDMERSGLYHAGHAGRNFGYSARLLRGCKIGRSGIFRTDGAHHDSFHAQSGGISSHIQLCFHLSAFRAALRPDGRRSLGHDAGARGVSLLSFYLGRYFGNDLCGFGVGGDCSDVYIFRGIPRRQLRKIFGLR